VAAGGGVWARSPLFGCLIRCFVLILNLCVFFEMMRCQVVSGGQKITHLCNYRITAALYVIYLYLIAMKKRKMLRVLFVGSLGILSVLRKT
jgi:hypothetical protein